MAGTKGAARPKRAPRQSYVVATLVEVGEFFGVGIDAVNRWRMSGMPGDVGKWDLGDIARWRQGQGRDTNGLSEEQKAADIRLKNASARAKELENEQTEGNLVDLRLVDTWVFEMITEARGQLETLPEVLGASVSPDIRAFVTSEADRVVRQVVKTLVRRHDDKAPLKESGDE